MALRQRTHGERPGRSGLKTKREHGTLSLNQSNIAKTQFDQALIERVLCIFAPGCDGRHQPTGTRGCVRGLHGLPHAQRVHEHHGARASMAGRTRPLLIAGGLVVMTLAGLAGLNSGEYTLTLAIGGLLATVVGGALVLFSGPAETNRRSLSVAEARGRSDSTPVENSTDLPDPLDQRIDMPL